MQKNLADKNPLTSKIFRKKIRNMKFFIGDSLKIPDFAGILSSILSTACLPQHPIRVITKGYNLIIYFTNA